MPYQAPKQKLHRHFAYLNQDAILNSLSALEAGKVDEIIQKTRDASDRGLEGTVGAGPVKVTGGKKQQAQMEYELVRTRTRFSAFEAWYQHLVTAQAIGRFDEWTLDVRNELQVGDTVEFTGRVEISPVYLLLTSYQSFVERVNKPGSVFKMTPAELKEAKSVAQMMQSWISRPDGTRSVLVNFLPFGIERPKMFGAIEETYVIGGLQDLQGTFSIVAQVDTVLDEDQRLSLVRVLNDVPASPLEVKLAEEGLSNFQGDAATSFGLEISDDDIRLAYPGVLLRPLAIYK